MKRPLCSTQDQDIEALVGEACEAEHDLDITKFEDEGEDK